jgi:hypothetical protein
MAASKRSKMTAVLLGWNDGQLGTEPSFGAQNGAKNTKVALRSAMAEDLLDAIRDQLANYAVGLVERVDGAGSKVRGSGMLASIEGRRGILTAGHVAEKYEKLPDVGLVRFIAGTQQRRIIKFEGARHLILESSDEWTETDLDLAFTYLAPEVADSIGAQSLFLNMEKNRAKIESGEPKGPRIDIMFGLVAEYSEKPVKGDGEFVSPMRASSTGEVCRATRTACYDFKQQTRIRRNCHKALAA